jgi:hypothetical protein
VNASPWRTWEVCDNLWQEGQEETVPTSCLNSLADCQQRVPVRASSSLITGMCVPRQMTHSVVDTSRVARAASLIDQSEVAWASLPS